MARPESVAKLGYFPAPFDAIRPIASHLRVSSPPEDVRHKISILDPCAGRGEAIGWLADLLRIDKSRAYAIELDPDRGAVLGDRYPKMNAIHPASFYGCRITPYSFGLAYVNPPFDHELGGGGREEFGFVKRASWLLAEGGILVLVCPFKALFANRDFQEYIDVHFQDAKAYRFPDHCRIYHEIVLIAKKRSKVLSSHFGLPGDAISRLGFPWNRADETFFPEIGQPAPVSYESVRYGEYVAGPLAESLATWEIPHAWPPHRFHKNQLTEPETIHHLKISPLNQVFAEPEPIPVPSPPLPLDRGHLGLVVSSGVLDGDVHDAGGSHLVRGSSYKAEFENEEESESYEDEKGAVTTKEVFSERIVTRIRCLDETGTILTLTNDSEAPRSVYRFDQIPDPLATTAADGRPGPEGATIEGEPTQLGLFG